MTFFLIAGHGKSGNNNDDGAVFAGTTERKEVVDICLDCIAIGTNAGVKMEAVGLYERMTLKEKIDYINNHAKPGDMAVSVHINSASENKGTGVEAWFKTGDAQSNQLARLVCDNTSIKTGLKNRGIKGDMDNRHGRLGIVRDVSIPCCIIECGFITHEYDRSLLTNDSKDNTFATGIIKGVQEFLSYDVWYSDIPDDAWYKDDVKLCLDEGILQMTNNKMFNPTKERVETIAMLARHIRLHHKT